LSHRARQSGLGGNWPDLYCCLLVLVLVSSCQPWLLVWRGQRRECEVKRRDSMLIAARTPEPITYVLVLSRETTRRRSCCYAGCVAGVADGEDAKNVLQDSRRPGCRRFTCLCQVEKVMCGNYGRSNWRYDKQGNCLDQTASPRKYLCTNTTSTTGWQTFRPCKTGRCLETWEKQQLTATAQIARSGGASV